MSTSADPHEVPALAADVHAWVDAHWDTSLTVRAWWRLLADAGYAYPTWPEGVGGASRPAEEARIILGVLARRRVVGPPVGHVAASLAAPTILEHGRPDQIATLVRAIALGEAAWCQLFSEPGSGSDLASVAAKAVLDGDEWIVTGQKVWSSGADTADLGLLLARTNIEVPKHRGMTYFALDMHQPGVDVRPLRQMNGRSDFCEVFLTGARVPVDRVVGEIDGGWRVAQTTLFHERRSVAGRGNGALAARSGGVAGDLGRTVGEVSEHSRRATARGGSTIRGGAVPATAMVALALDHGVAADPVIRQELARYVSQVRVNGWTTRRSAAAGGRLTGADGSIIKLMTARICQRSRDLSYAVVGARGLLDGPESPLAGDLQRVGLASPGTRIGGGSDEIQLNVLGERALALPREPGDDRDVPYRDLAVGTHRSAG